MPGPSGIEWTEATWNPVTGCDKVSPGCAHCYAETFAERWRGIPGHPYEQGFDLRLWPQRLGIPARWKKPRMIFVNSMSDFFHEGIPAEFTQEVWAAIRRAPQHTYQILTKRPERVAERLPADWGEGWPHVWLGVSVENRRFVHRADLLRETPAAVRFVSAEPLLGPLIGRCDCFIPSLEGAGQHSPGCSAVKHGPDLDLTGIDWLIVGGESGPRHRPVREEWVRDLRDASQEPTLVCCTMRDELGRCCNQPDNEGPRTAFFFKQWGGARPGGEALLDGREWREFPYSPAFVGQGVIAVNGRPLDEQEAEG